MLFLKEITAENFRNFIKTQAEFCRGINIIHGDNAQGKTNLLESVFFCGAGRSPRAASEREIVRFGENESHLCLKFERNGAEEQIDAHIKLFPKAGKFFSINKVPLKKVGELLGKLLVVMFTPDDLNLVKSGPAERRAFMDTEICQLSPVYINELREYHRVLKQRNHLLKQYKTGPADTDALSVWDEQLAKHGARIMRFRASFIRQADTAAAEIHSRITVNERLSLIYEPSVTEPDLFLDELTGRRVKDIAVGSTTVGIHKDEVQILINGIPARSFGSQGQQRTAALSVKLAEIKIINENTGLNPVLLLDDVLSELDENRQRFLLKQISNMQVLITCTGVEDIIRKNETGLLLYFPVGEKIISVESWGIAAGSFSTIRCQNER